MRNMSSMGRPWSSPTPNITAHTHRQTKDRVLEISAIFFWRGVCPSPSPSSSPAMRPTSVSMPVPVTTHTARPRVMTVDASTILCRSARGVSSGRADSSPLDTGTDSPVMALSSAWREAASRIRASAGTRSPASRWMMSPGTSRSVSSR